MALRVLAALALLQHGAASGLDATPGVPQLDAKALRRTARRVSNSTSGALFVRFYLSA
jgi:hypothetical protein